MLEIVLLIRTGRRKDDISWLFDESISTTK